MIELVLVFFLGMLAAGLVWLLLLPAIWRRAERLTLERVQRALPLNTNEILAERDRERAGFAVERLALEARIDAARAEVLAAKTEVGARLGLETGVAAARDEALARIAAQELTLRALQADLAGREETIARLGAANEAAQELRQTLLEECRTLQARLAAAMERSEHDRRARDEAQVHAETARSAEAEERARNATLRADLQSRQLALRELERRIPDEATSAGDARQTG